jgi:hypothetical protein
VVDSPAPLTELTEDERLLRQSVREFSDAQVRPLVRQMDEQASMPRAPSINSALGIMGIEIPSALAGRAGRSSRPCSSSRNSRASTRLSRCWST